MRVITIVKALILSRTAILITIMRTSNSKSTITQNKMNSCSDS